MLMNEDLTYSAVGVFELCVHATYCERLGIDHVIDTFMSPRSKLFPHMPSAVLSSNLILAECRQYNNLINYTAQIISR